MVLPAGLAVLAALAEPLPTVSSDAPDHSPPADRARARAGAVTAVPPAVGASDDELPQVATDRPDMANSTFTVAPGAWQAELDIDATVYAQQRSSSLPVLVPTSLRIGIARRVELRVLDGDPLPLLDERSTDSGGLSFGVKVRFNDAVEGRRIPSFGVQVYLVRLIAPRPARLRVPAAGGFLIWTQSIAPWLSFDVNLGAEVYPIDDDRGVGVTSTGAISTVFPIHERFDPYLELYGMMGQTVAGGRLLAADGGAIVRLSRRIAVDVGTRVGLVTSNREVGVMAGITWLLADGVRWRRYVAGRARPR